MVLKTPSCPSPVGKMSGSPVQKPSPHRFISTKVLLAEGEDTPFTEHCRHYEDSYRAEIMGDILRRSLLLDTQIASEYASLEGRRAIFQEIWEDSYQRVATQQEIYEAQLRDLLQLRQENAYLTIVTKQITPYIRSIARVKERLEPRFQVPVDEHAEHGQNMYDETPGRTDPGCTTEKRDKASEPNGSSWSLSSLPEGPSLKNQDHLRPKLEAGDEGWRAGSGSKGACYQA